MAIERSRARVHAKVTVTAAEADVPVRQAINLKVTVRDIDLPAFVSDGKLYIQAPLGLFFEAVAEEISASIRDLEVRISNESGTSFSLDSVGRPLHR
jgi:hypothetical protein